MTAPLANILTGPQSVFTVATAPTMGNVNSYNATGGAFANTLPALSGLNVGANCIVEKSTVDTSYNQVTFTAAGSDTFDDTTTTFYLNTPGDKAMLQVISVAGVKHWKQLLCSTFPPKSGIVAITSAVTLTSSTTLTPIVATSLIAGALSAGSSFRISLRGTIATLTTSGTLTFTPYIQGTALSGTAVMPSQAAFSASGFALEFLITVRTVGSSGTAIATPNGVINFTTPVNLFSTVTTTTTVNTTIAAGSNVLQVQAQWGTNSASNILVVTEAIIERMT
jgi:hypothetical protein